MLIEFRVANFRSFHREQTISMVAGLQDEHRNTNTFDTTLKGFDRLLSTAVVYGPNAAGKTNLLRALQFMQAMVVSSASATSYPVPYTPYKFASNDGPPSPSEFEVTFIQNGIRYEYGFAMGPERIEQEWLVEYVHARGRTMFERVFEQRKDSYRWKFSSFLRGHRTLWSEATRPDALFLSTAIQLNSEQLRPVFEWFQKRLVVVVGVTTMNPSLTLKLLSEKGGKEKLLPLLREADAGIADIEVKREPIPVGAVVLQGASQMIDQSPGSPTPSLVRVTFSHAVGTRGDGKRVDLDFSDESSGAQVLFRTAGAWLNVFRNGEILLIDEIDTSLHSLLARFLIQRFHSRETNPLNAQLIFSTHNTSHLSLKYFRRDQVWFIDKDFDGASRLYPLTDFKPRNDEVLENWYMRGRYGALPMITDTGS
jgi:uncharacterized protein